GSSSSSWRTDENPPASSSGRIRPSCSLQEPPRLREAYLRLAGTAGTRPLRGDRRNWRQCRRLLDLFRCPDQDAPEGPTSPRLRLRAFVRSLPPAVDQPRSQRCALCHSVRSSDLGQDGVLSVLRTQGAPHQRLTVTSVRRTIFAVRAPSHGGHLGGASPCG